MLRDSKVGIIVQTLRLLDLQAPKVGVPDKFMSGDHAVGPNRDNLTIMLDLIDHNAESIQLGEVFILDKIILASDIQNLQGLVAALEEDLFVLS